MENYCNKGKCLKHYRFCALLINLYLIHCKHVTRVSSAIGLRSPVTTYTERYYMLYIFCFETFKNGNMQGERKKEKKQQLEVKLSEK